LCSFDQINAVWVCSVDLIRPSLVLAAMLGQPEIMGMLLFPAAMLMAAMFFSSIYFTFRDSFVLEETPAVPA